MSRILKGYGWPTAAIMLVVALCAATAQAQPDITCNNSAFGGGPITTFDFTGGATVGSFVPTSAVGFDNGRGLLVLGNKVYYTELIGGSGPTDFIRVAPFNGGAGGADTGALPNPRPTVGVQDVAFSNGVMYILTGYPTDTPEVFGLDPVTGAVVSGPVAIAAPAATDSDGFTVLANGNFLINSGDGSCTYNQFNPTTGALIAATTILVPGAGFCTGVESDGTSLFFQRNNDSFTKTTLSGTLIASQTVAANSCEDISLDISACSGAKQAIPGKPNCHGKCVSFLARTHGGLNTAASDFGYTSVKSLQQAIDAFCLKGDDDD